MTEILVTAKYVRCPDAVYFISLALRGDGPGKLTQSRQDIYPKMSKSTSFTNKIVPNKIGGNEGVLNHRDTSKDIISLS